ncbi:low-density lipoprotein receptor-related protein, partial [Elysia marginata]
ELEDYRHCVRIYVQYFCDWQVGVEVFNFYKFHLESLKPSNCQLEIPCPLNEFQCSNGACIPDVSACDGHTDCDDASDENRCAPQCNQNQFECGYTCVDKTKVCAGNKRCGRRSVKKACGNYACMNLLECKKKAGFDINLVIPNYIPTSFKTNERLFLECLKKNFRACKSRPARQQSNKAKRLIRYLSRGHVVKAISNSTCKDDPTEYRAMLESVTTLCTTEFLHPPLACRKLKDYHWCIYEAVRRRCGYKMAYHAYKLSLFRHKSSRKRFKCPRIGGCYLNQLMCRGRRRCVKDIKICDGRQDCQHGEDEENCGAKEIWLVGENSQPKLGEKFTMKCAAKGGAEFRSVDIQWYSRRSGESESIKIRDKLAGKADSLYGRAHINESRSGTRIDSYLRIDSVRLEDVGDYFCTSGTLESSHYKLRVLNTGAFFK